MPGESDRRRAGAAKRESTERESTCDVELRVSWRCRDWWRTESEAAYSMTNHAFLGITAAMAMSSALSALPAQSQTRKPMALVTDTARRTTAGCPGGIGNHISATG